jgi:hypothetical protein
MKKLAEKPRHGRVQKNVCDRHILTYRFGIVFHDEAKVLLNGGGEGT